MLKNLLLSSLLFSTILLSSCSNLEIKDTTGCAVAGIILAGADCFHTLTDDTEHLSTDDFLDMLEAKDAPYIDSNGVMIPAHPAAIVIPAADYVVIKTDLEILCANAGSSCTFEQKKILQRMSAFIKKLNITSSSTDL